jgi:hypothetical protein
MWAWSFGRIYGTRLRTFISNEARTIVMAFSSASSVSLIRSSRPAEGFGEPTVWVAENQGRPDRPFRHLDCGQGP